MSIPSSGKMFCYGGYDWVVLGYEQGGLLSIKKEPISMVCFDENGSADWSKSSLRKYLNHEFLRHVPKPRIVPFVTDIMTGKTDLVFLLSEELYQKYAKYTPNGMEWSWLITPYPSPYSFENRLEKYVANVGNIRAERADFSSFDAYPCVLFSLKNRSSYKYDNK